MPTADARGQALDLDILRVDASTPQAAVDWAAVEEPLELRLGGLPFVVIMRTPGADRDLAAGFLVSERIVRARAEVKAMRYCDDRDDTNVLNVWLEDEAAFRASQALADRRPIAVQAACGVCGRRSIDDLLETLPPVAGSVSVTRAVINALPDSLRIEQHTFSRTGGLHAAGLFDPAGTLLRLAEDVGRHNAVDKVIGAALLADDLPLSNTILFVSGRTSFDVVQKACVAGITVVASVSAPSSLAVRLAREAGMTLVGFVRGGSFNVYSGGDRLTL